MGKSLGNVFNVTKRFKSKPSINIGDFNTLNEAQAAMKNHYIESSKRGNFSYVISEDELEEIGGVVFRMTAIVISKGAKNYYKKYSMDELKGLV